MSPSRSRPKAWFAYWLLAIGPLAGVLLSVTAGGASAWCVAGVERWDTLSIRTGPGVFSAIKAVIAPSACGIKVVGACYDGWCPISFRGYSGWSSSYYLVSQTAPGGRREAASRAMHPSRSAQRGGPRLASIAPAADSPGPRPPGAAAPDDDSRPARRRQNRIATPAPTPPAPVEARRPLSRQTPPASPPTPAPAPAPATAAREVCVQGVPRGETLKVRSGPGPTSDLRYGFLPDTCGVRISGECKDGWCPVEYRGYKGWAEEKNLR